MLKSVKPVFLETTIIKRGTKYFKEKAKHRYKKEATNEE
jgi:hypothetical protein